MRELLNEVTLKFMSKSANESFARSTAAAFVSQLDPTIDELNDLKTAVSEAVTNCTVHAYGDSVGMIVMSIKIYVDGHVHITIKDRGIGIQNIAEARVAMYTTGGAERSGMGFTIMESFMDKLSVSSRIGRGTTVKMQKMICRKTQK